jgi:phosphonate ABC transporter permease subunit PhnE
MKNGFNVRRSLGLGAAVVIALLIYAYGFAVTQVRLDQIQSPERQERLIRITRALFQPDIFEYDREEFQVNIPIQVPCPEGGVSVPEPDRAGPYMVITPPCADPGAEIAVEGFNFEPNTTGPLNFIPPSGVSLQMGRIQTDAEGHFSLTAKLPRRPSQETQTIRAVTRRNVGLPHFSRNAVDTWNKIIETVFLALLATTLSTALAVPLSFFAARNLMKDVTSPLPSVALSILAWPIGLVAGAFVAGWMNRVGAMLTANVATNIGSLLLSPALVVVLTRWALPQDEARAPGPLVRLARLLALLVSVLAGLLVLFLGARLASILGQVLTARLGALSFLAAFVGDLGDILALLLIPLTALIGGFTLSGAAGNLGQFLNDRTAGARRLALNTLLGVTAGAVLAALIGVAIGWLYEIDNPTLTQRIPAAVGALGGLAVALASRRQDALPLGLVIYYVSRTIFNTLRSIEAVIMVIWFVVWVGIGPFAGMLALALHSIAAMAKLYSEQVESIMAGPVEAVKATGATRLQTILYAVIPQVIPPYISFTMYRWDINVRMSTIIGFAGGGGIGFLLQQNVNLLNYRAAATQILAIAIVVATMDFLSAKLRERAI